MASVSKLARFKHELPSEHAIKMFCNELKENERLRREAEELRKSPYELYEAIKHGDAEHKEWLKEAIENFFSGKSAPPPRGQGNKEKRIEELEGALRFTPINNDVPPDCVIVLTQAVNVITEETELFTAYLHHHTSIWYCHYPTRGARPRIADGYIVTHWMHLPKHAHLIGRKDEDT